MISKYKRTKTILLTGIISYLVGCVLYYFLWYKNGQLLHYLIIALIIGGMLTFILQYKEDKLILTKRRSYKTLFTIVFIVFFAGGFGVINFLEKKRINSIFAFEPTKQVIATVVAVDLRSTRSGKQPWSIIDYYAENHAIEQSFADTSKNLIVGRKYLIEYAVKYPDMFRVLRALE